MIARIPKIHRYLADVVDPFPGVLLDAYGVFWGGNEIGVFPGSKEAMGKLVADGKIVGILSNATQQPSKEIEKIQKHGLELGKHFHFFVTSGGVARAFFMHDHLPFKTSNNKFFLFGGVHPIFASHMAIFQDSIYTETLDVGEADFIYISVPHIDGRDVEDPELFRNAIEKIRPKNLPMICTNPDLFAHEGNPPTAVVRQGSIAKMYEEMGGKVFYIGKPYSQAYDAAMKRFAHFQIKNPSDILMVGDSPRTDIRGARSYGMKSVLITETGTMADHVLALGFLKALEALPPSDRPDYFIQRLNG